MCAVCVCCVYILFLQMDRERIVRTLDEALLTSEELGEYEAFHGDSTNAA